MILPERKSEESSLVPFCDGIATSKARSVQHQGDIHERKSKRRKKFEGSTCDNRLMEVTSFVEAGEKGLVSHKKIRKDGIRLDVEYISPQGLKSKSKVTALRHVAETTAEATLKKQVEVSVVTTIHRTSLAPNTIQRVNKGSKDTCRVPKGPLWYMRAGHQQETSKTRLNPEAKKTTMSDKSRLADAKPALPSKSRPKSKSSKSSKASKSSKSAKPKVLKEEPAVHLGKFGCEGQVVRKSERHDVTSVSTAYTCVGSNQVPIHITNSLEIYNNVSWEQYDSEMESFFVDWVEASDATEFWHSNGITLFDPPGSVTPPVPTFGKDWT